MADSLTRRSVLILGGVTLGAAALIGSPALDATASAAAPGAGAPAKAGSGARDAGSPWRTADRIVRDTARPRIGRRRVLITDFGAVGDGTTLCTAAIDAAVRGCSKRGGGQVVVPAGRFLTGAVVLRSNVELHIETGATLAFSKNTADYLPVVRTQDGGIELYNYSPFIYALDQHDIAITGDGTIDGQCGSDAWWPWAGKSSFGWVVGMPTAAADRLTLVDMAARGEPVEQRVFGAGHYLRPCFIQPYRCTNVLIQGVTLVNAPNWQINPVLCTNVTVDHVIARSAGPNTDGCDPDSCDHVVVQSCTFDTGDDCIAIKSGLNQDGWRMNVPSQNIVIQDCEFLNGHGGITIGSEMSGGVRNVFARNNRMDATALSNCLRLKTNSGRGGFIENIFLSSTTVQSTTGPAILIDFFYGEGAGLGHNPLVKGIEIDHLSVGSCQSPIYAVGYPEDHICDISVTNSAFDVVGGSGTVAQVDNLTYDEVYVGGALAQPPV